METENNEDPFAIPDFSKISSLAQLEVQPTMLTAEPWYINWDDIPWNQGLHVEDSKALEDIGCLELVLQNPFYFKYGPLESPETFESFPTSSAEESNDEEDRIEDDPWAAPQISTCEPHFGTKSWEVFHDRDFKEARTVYLSEGGPGVFDTALKLHQDGHTGLQPMNQVVINGTAFIKGLAQLGLGRDSLFFKYDMSNKKFQQVFEGGHISGYSTESFSSLVATFQNYGNSTKRIQRFVDYVYALNKPFPTFVALANAFCIVLSALRSRTGKLSLSATSVLQLQSVFERHGLILACIHEIIERVITVRSDEILLSSLYIYLQDLEDTNAGIRNVGLEILGHASKPWLESLSCWLGIKKTISVESRSIADNFKLMKEGRDRSENQYEIQKFEQSIQLCSLPAFMVNEDAAIILETGRSLQLLREHKAQHPLVRSSTGMENNRILQWQFSWLDAEQVLHQAKEYERSISKAIKEFHTKGPSEPLSAINIETSQSRDNEVLESSKEAIEAQIAASNLEIEFPIFQHDSTNIDPLEQAIISCTSFRNEGAEVEDAKFAPPLSLVPLLSFNPIISTQARLVNQACLRLLFKEHNVRLHLSVLNRYNLFGDAVFAARLSHALFDPEMQSAERRKGHSRSGISGLRLGSRDTWPPASSELRLALMGILTDSFYENNHAETSTSLNSELPGGLSFAVREMSEDDFKRCMDPDSIEALDFLQLQYKPPALLEVVITPLCLAKYDALFKLLHRGTRMLYVVNQFFRDADGLSSQPFRINTIVRKFKLEAHHVVSTIYSYFFDGIKASWRIFSRRLDEIEKQLDQYDSQQHEGLHGLRDFHEKVLDRMMFAVFLRKRQEQVMGLLEEIFSTVLVFARFSRNDFSSSIDGNNDHGTIEDTYHHFTKKVRLFVSVCKGLSERRGLGGLSTHKNMLDHDGIKREDMISDGENTVGQLLLALDMNGYYSRPL